ncbi:MAG TPA: histidine kinase [Mycobacteriales bacterium]|nr:histidine kinase [Mycobacteriales bacterium]
MPAVPIEKLRGWPLDVAISVAVGIGAVSEVFTNHLISPRTAALPCELFTATALVARRRYPLATVVAVSVSGAAEAIGGVAIDQPWVPLAAMMIATYTLVSRARVDRAVIGLLCTALAFAVQVIDQHKGFGNFAFGAAFVLPIFLVARAMRRREDQAEQEARQSEQLAIAAVEAERRRIARELHDVVSHGLGVMVLQAGAAQSVADRDPAKTRELLESIRLTGLEAVNELGTLLALVRAEPSDELVPAPRLTDLEPLVERMREAGLLVDLDLDISNLHRPLPAPLELSAYRIVQEGLTNALKYAAGSTVRVVVSCNEHSLDIDVTDSGRRGAPARGGNRQGLVGVTERVAVFGGRVHAGPVGEGWALRASLPLPS